MRPLARALVVLASVSLAGALGCADLTRPDVQVHADPAVASAPKSSAPADRAAVRAPTPPAEVARVDVQPLVADPSLVHNILPSPTNPAPAAAAGGGGG
jgi:hypothetical protein